jgi:hypothetical protein
MMMNWGSYRKGDVIENMGGGQADLFIRRGIVKADPQGSIEFAEVPEDSRREQASIIRKKRRNAVPQFETDD